MKINTLCSLFAIGLIPLLAIAKMAAPTQEMGIILRTLEEKGGKPIEKLSASEARKQPTPSDAVKTLMKNRKITDMPLVSIQEIKVDGAKGPIHARVYIPIGANKPIPVVVLSLQTTTLTMQHQDRWPLRRRPFLYLLNIGKHLNVPRIKQGAYILAKLIFLILLKLLSQSCLQFF